MKKTLMAIAVAATVGTAQAELLVDKYARAWWAEEDEIPSSYKARLDKEGKLCLDGYLSDNTVRTANKREMLDLLRRMEPRIRDPKEDRYFPYYQVERLAHLDHFMGRDTHLYAYTKWYLRNCHRE